MASPIDPTFGAGFNASEFRDAIRNTMMMGLPDSTAERITFKWDTEREYEVTDNSGMPFRWDDDPTTVVEHDDVQIPAAVKFVSRAASGGNQTPFGDIDNSRVEITVLDVDFELVRGANKVTFDSNDYYIDFIKPPDGLFDVTIYTLYATAEDES